MGKQYNKIEKRKRRARYLKRKKTATKARTAKAWTSCSWSCRPVFERPLYLTGRRSCLASFELTQRMGGKELVHRSPCFSAPACEYWFSASEKESDSIDQNYASAECSAAL